MRIPPTRHAQSDELAIAYQVHGAGEHDLPFSGTTASNVETVRELPEAHRLFERLGRFCRVIRFDRRDTGISDPIKDDVTLEAHVSDALAVMDAASVQRAVLLGGADGARSLAALAATHPERAAGLIAVTPSARGGVVAAPEIALDELDWPGRLLPMWAPEWADDPVRRERLSRYIRASATPRQTRRIIEMSARSDITDVLPLIQAPTLVLWPDGAHLPQQACREFAELVPQSTFRTVTGSSALLRYALDVDHLADLIDEFVTAPCPPRWATASWRRCSSPTSSGPRRWRRSSATGRGRACWPATRRRRAARSSHTAARSSRPSATACSRCSPARRRPCAAPSASWPTLTSPGSRSVATSTPARSSGSATTSPGWRADLAARIAGLASGGDVLVSRTVRDLTVGSELGFADRGQHEFKGLPEPWNVFAAV